MVRRSAMTEAPSIVLLPMPDAAVMLSLLPTLAS
ncbi:hypothetical protein FHT80_002927 [Rhizobium sp. BK226]|jgi:hypothetical protein|nr:hypothetical protein [Rhizobium sp. BK112]MBB3369115.1 hypothetical protein [Rhizobium sp. BK077]MBB4113601.1 hypothetical protein [Rhizobium sp. BK226]MBB4179507.1 hypothetical protein [Rhizobium sp. BK109]